MKKEVIEGILSNPLFKFFNDDEKENLRQDLKSKEDIPLNESNYLYFYANLLFDNYSSTYNENYVELAAQAVVDAAVKKDLINWIYNDEECQKIRNVVSKKQYNAKIIKELELKLSYIFHRFDYNNDNLKWYFRASIEDKIDECLEKEALKNYGELKSLMDKIASGINNKVYDELKYNQYLRFSDEVNSYVLDKYGYNFNENTENFSLYVGFGEKFASFSKYLTKKDDFNFCQFINLVEKYNDLAHVTKIIDYCFKQFEKEHFGKKILDNHLPLKYIDLSKENLLDYSERFLYQHIFDRYDIVIDDCDFDGLLYPLNNVDENILEIGKNKFEKFIKLAYGDKEDKFYQIFSNLDSVIQDQSERKRQLFVRTFVEAHIYGYDLQSTDRKIIDCIYEGFDSNNNAYLRFYYLIYIIDKYSRNNFDAIIYEYLYDLFDMISTYYGLECKYTVNEDMRNNNYIELKNILAKFNFNINDEYKKSYITALLDRKYARLEEKAHFPEFEMLGDAIYDLAVSELRFYNQNENVTAKDQMVSAINQIEVAKHIGVDKLYIANSVNKESCKIDVMDGDYSYYNFKNKKRNYIADSLEMIIGVLAIEFGEIKALNFTKQIIIDTYPEYNEKSLNFEQAMSSNVDQEYFNKLFIDLFDDSQYEDYFELRRSLSKFLITVSIGTDTKQKRQAITYHSLNDKYIGDSNVNEATFIYYLYNGIENTLNVVRNRIKENYEKINK